MNQGILRSSIIAAAIAVVMWIVFSLLFAEPSTGDLISGAIVFGLIGLIGTYVITTVITRSKQ